MGKQTTDNPAPGTREAKTALIAVGFALHPVQFEPASKTLQSLLPTVERDSRLTNAEKIQADLQTKTAALLEKAASQPYTATFASVVLVDPAHEHALKLTAKDRDGKKPPIFRVVRNWLLEHNPGAWPDDTHPAFSKPKVAFFGFNPRLFLKILGLECSMPGPYHCPLPPPLWYDNTDHRDIGKALIPDEFVKSLSLFGVLCLRGINPKEAWAPHVDPEEDVRITIEAAAQLGFLVPR